MRILIKAMEVIEDLEVVLFPVSVAAKVHPDPVNDFESVLKKAQELDIGVTAIKAIAQGRWQSEQEKQAMGINTWYKPLTDPEWITKAVHFTLSQGGVTAYSLPAEISLWKYVLEAGESFQPMSLKEQQSLIEQARTEKFNPLFLE